tara:strand:- start:258 stop:515 length:258 start_codon:yes stop_codon:yes gene_type:complete
MSKLLIPLLAALALPTTVNSESVYLVVKTTTGSMMRENGQLIVVPMKTMDGCEEEGQKLVSSERFIKGKFGKITRDISFECLESK